MPDRGPCCRLCLSNDDVSLLGWSLQHAAQHRSCQGPYLWQKHRVCVGSFYEVRWEKGSQPDSKCFMTANAHIDTSSTA